MPDNFNTLKLNNGIATTYGAPVPEFCPDFGAAPTQIAARTGLWRSIGIWWGVFLKGTKALVGIKSGTVVTYDVDSVQPIGVVVIEGPSGNQPGAKLVVDPGVSTRLTVQTLIVKAGGTMGVNLTPGLEVQPGE